MWHHTKKNHHNMKFGIHRRRLNNHKDALKQANIHNLPSQKKSLIQIHMMISLSKWVWRMLYPASIFHSSTNITYFTRLFTAVQNSYVDLTTLQKFNFLSRWSEVCYIQLQCFIQAWKSHISHIIQQVEIFFKFDNTSDVFFLDLIIILCSFSPLLYRKSSSKYTLCWFKKETKLCTSLLFCVKFLCTENVLHNNAHCSLEKYPKMH